MLDTADKRLHTACTKKGVPFRWPVCLSKRSADEDKQIQSERRATLRAILLTVNKRKQTDEIRLQRQRQRQQSGVRPNFSPPPPVIIYHHFPHSFLLLLYYKTIIIQPGL